MHEHTHIHKQEQDNEGQGAGKMDHKRGGKPLLVLKSEKGIERTASSGSSRGVGGGGGGMEEKDISPKPNSKPEPGVHPAEPDLESQEPSQKPRTVMEYRIWTDKIGQYRKEMILLGCENNHVLLLKRNGARLNILKSDLSPQDQEFVTQAMESPIQTSLKELPPNVNKPVAPPKHSDKSKPDPSKIRSWLDVTGRYSVDAQLVGFRKGKIVLHRTNGVKVGVIPDQMAKDDLAFAEKQLGMVLTGLVKEKKGKVIA